jgi:hypothetical protein
VTGSRSPFALAAPSFQLRLAALGLGPFPASLQEFGVGDGVFRNEPTFPVVLRKE